MLREHCRDTGTDFERIERTSSWNFSVDDGGPRSRELLERLRWLADLGIDTVVGRVPDIEQRTPLEWLARHIIPAAAELISRKP